MSPFSKTIHPTTNHEYFSKCHENLLLYSTRPKLPIILDRNP